MLGASKLSGLLDTFSSKQAHILFKPKRTVLSWNTKFSGEVTHQRFHNSRGHVSYVRRTTVEALPVVTRLKRLLLGTTVAASLVFGYLYITDTRAGVHRWLVVPALRWIYDDAEEAHEAGTKALKTLYNFGLHPRERSHPAIEKGLEVEVSYSQHSCG